MNIIEKFQAFIKTLPPIVQSAFYSVETGVALALGIYLAALAMAIDAAINGKPFAFDFAAQNRFLGFSAAGAVVKAIIEIIRLIFGAGPTQVPKGNTP